MVVTEEGKKRKVTKNVGGPYFRRSLAAKNRGEKYKHEIVRCGLA